MKVGDLVKHYGDHDIGLIIETHSDNELRRKGSVLVYWPEEGSFGWYLGKCLEVFCESR